jgi:hypothetical protein
MTNLPPLPGPPPSIPLLPVPLLGLGVAGPHRNLASFYRDESLDPCHGVYARIMDRFDPEVNRAISHDMLLEQAVRAGAVPQPYLFCAVRQQQLHIYCLLLPSKFTRALDGQNPPLG